MKPPDCLHCMEWHPFWHIRRSNCVGEFNSEVVGVDIKVTSTSSVKGLRTDENTITSRVLDFTVTVPCITNTVDIAPVDEIVLKFEKKSKRSLHMRRPVCHTWGVNAPKKTKR